MNLILVVTASRLEAYEYFMRFGRTEGPRDLKTLTVEVPSMEFSFRCLVVNSLADIETAKMLHPVSVLISTACLPEVQVLLYEHFRSN